MTGAVLKYKKAGPYLDERSKKPLKISGELAQGTSLHLGIAVSTDLNKYGYASLQPAQIPLL